VLNGHTNSIYALEMTQMTRFLVSCSADETIRLWDLTTGNCVKTLHGHKDNVYTIKLNTYGQLISGSHDKTVKIWDLDRGECLKTINVDSLIWMIELCKIF
jgi:WD40 repeat protein